LAASALSCPNRCGHHPKEGMGKDDSILRRMIIEHIVFGILVHKTIEAIKRFAFWRREESGTLLSTPVTSIGKRDL